jgi:hypothetical protein
MFPDRPGRYLPAAGRRRRNQARQASIACAAKMLALDKPRMAIITSNMVVVLGGPATADTKPRRPCTVKDKAAHGRSSPPTDAKKHH